MLSIKLKILASAIILAAGGCSRSSHPPVDPKSPEGQIAGKIARGRAVYQSICIACHNSDPKLPGAVGPEIAGSSLELLRARVLEGTYPPGYKPKRTTTAMTKLPQVAPDLEALHAYLQADVAQ